MDPAPNLNFMSPRENGGLKNLFSDRKKLTNLLLILFLLVILPLGVYLATSTTIFRPKASNSNNVKLYNRDNGQVIPPGTKPTGDVKITIEDTSW